MGGPAGTRLIHTQARKMDPAGALSHTWGIQSRPVVQPLFASPYPAGPPPAGCVPGGPAPPENRPQMASGTCANICTVSWRPKKREIAGGNGRFASIHRGRKRPLPQHNQDLVKTVGQSNRAAISPQLRRQTSLFATMGTAPSQID